MDKTIFDISRKEMKRRIKKSVSTGSTTSFRWIFTVADCAKGGEEKGGMQTIDLGKKRKIFHLARREIRNEVNKQTYPRMSRISNHFLERKTICPKKSKEAITVRFSKQTYVCHGKLRRKTDGGPFSKLSRSPGQFKKLAKEKRQSYGKRKVDHLHKDTPNR